jgi:hypothetical protein
VGEHRRVCVFGMRYMECQLLQSRERIKDVFGSRMFRRRIVGRMKKRTTARFMGLMFLATALSLGACGHGSVASQINDTPTYVVGALRPCGPPQVHGPLRTVSVEVVNSSEATTRVFVGVCIGNHGPYPFLLDTGSPSSLVTPTTLRNAGIAVGKPTGILGGIGCSERGARVMLNRWSLAGAPLTPQLVEAAAMTAIGQFHPAGIIGYDVLGRFRAFRLDYSIGTLTLDGQEAAAPRSARIIKGLLGRSVVNPLVESPSAQTIPITVVEGGDEAGAYTYIYVGGHRETFALDTGAELSGVSSYVARALSLRTTASSLRLSALACTVTVRLIRKVTWSFPGVGLPNQSLADLGSLDGVGGVVGSDALRHYDAIVIDNADGLLILGS